MFFSKKMVLVFSASLFMVPETQGLWATQQDNPPKKAIDAAPQRPSFTTDTSITTPGTLELEFGATISGSFLALPTSLKFTPNVQNPFLYRTEFSLGFDTITSQFAEIVPGKTQFGDMISLAIRHVAYQDDSFSFAVVPLASFFFRDNKGARLGLAGLATYSFGLNSIIGNVVFSGATSPSPDNTSSQLDTIIGYGRSLKAIGILSRVSAFAEFLHQAVGDESDYVSLLQGISYRIRPEWVIDFAVQQDGVLTGLLEVQFLVGFTLNLGHLHRW